MYGTLFLWTCLLRIDPCVAILPDLLEGPADAPSPTPLLLEHVRPAVARPPEEPVLHTPFRRLQSPGEYAASVGAYRTPGCAPAPGSILSVLA